MQPGREQPNESRPRRGLTSFDVAAAAGVSQATVSRALRSDPRVNRRTVERVRLAADRLGYVPSERGRSLSTQRTGCIGVVVEDLGNPFYLELLDALHERLESSRMRMTVFAPGEHDPEQVRHLADGSIDGAVLTTTTLGSPLPAQLNRLGFPFVLLNRIVDGPICDSCSVDNRGGAWAIAHAMVEQGHHRIGAILGPTSTSTGRDRERGLRDGLLSRGTPLDETLVRRGEFSFVDGERLLHELLDAQLPPTAVFCANDVIALGACEAAARRSVAVPRELSLVGFDDIRMSSWAAFALTTARGDLRRMVAGAADLLLARIRDPARPPEQIVQPAELMMRCTLGPAPGD